MKRINNTIYEIQDLIGYTSGGVPFAREEEIKEWIKGEELYPDWLQRINDII